MEPAEILERLSTYRPGVDDAADPLFAAAERDPELARWLEEEQSLDANFARKLQQAPMPADLKSNLLGLAKVVAPPASRWRQTWLPALASAAAAAVVTWLTALATLKPVPAPQPTVSPGTYPVTVQATLEDFRAEMVSFVRLTFSLERESKDVDKLRAILR